MKKTTLFLLLSSFCCGFLSAQNYINLYVPLFNASITIEGKKNDLVSPFCLDASSLQEDNWYWAVNADVAMQGLFNLYTGNDMNVNGGIVHGRIGYAFWNTNKNFKKGFAFDGPIRYFHDIGVCFGAGLTYFMLIAPKDSKFVIIPHFSAGKLRDNGTKFSGGGYISIEADIMYKAGKSIGFSLKPFIFSSLGTQSQFGFKIGFCKYLHSSKND